MLEGPRTSEGRMVVLRPSAHRSICPALVESRLMRGVVGELGASSRGLVGSFGCGVIAGLYFVEVCY